MGIQNYIKVFQESELRKAIGNTFLYTFVVVVFKNLWAAAGAGIQFKFKNKKLFKSGYFSYLVFFPSVVIGLVFVPILHPYGFFEYLFEAAYLGFMAQNWLDKCKYRYVKHCGSIYLAVDRLSYGNLSRLPARDIKGVL